MTAQPTAGPATRTRHLTAGLAQPGAAARPATRTTRSGARGRALLAALGLALAAAILPATAVHASPQAPDVNDELTNQVGNPPPPEPPDPVQDGPEDLAPPTETPEPPLPPDPPDVPDWGPDDLAPPTETPDPPLPPDPPDGPDDEANPTENPEPPNPTDDPDPAPPADDSIPTPQRVDAGFGGAAAGSHQLAGVALIAAALVLALLVVVIARRPLEA
jgi:hypothetical protein